jgi:hypothetical protein
MRISSAGNVLINHTAGVSETKLYVEGSAMPATGDAASVEDMLTLYRYGSPSVWSGGASLAVGRYSTGGSSDPKSRLDFKLKDVGGTNVAAPEATVMTMQSNGNVGIGTTTPDTKLHITGILKLVENSNTAFYAGNYVRVFGDQNYGFRNTSGTTVANISMGGNSYFNGGNVGIGTTDPSFKLHVDSDVASGDVCFIHHDNASQSSGTVMRIRSDAGNNAGSALLNVENNSGAALYVRGDRNVGIGTTSPLYKLQVQDRIHIEDTATLQPKISFSENTNSNGEFVLEYNGVGGGAVNYVSFYSEVTGWVSKGNGLNYIPQNGYVGIGTTAPGEKLEVEGTVYATPIAFAANQDAYALKIGASNNVAFDMGVKIKSTSGGVPYMSFRSASTEDVIVVGGSNVGIGTTNPLSKLHVAGGTSTQTTLTIGANGTNSDKSSKLFFNEGENGVTDSKKFGFSVAYDGQGSQYPGLAANEFGIIRHNNSVNGDVVMKIARTSNNATFIGNVIGNGNIGLGTTNPVSQLNSTKVIKLQSTGNGEVILDHTDAGTASDLGLYSWERNNDHLAHIKATCEGSTTAAFISFHAQPSGGSFANPAANEKMRISSSGNVTIQGTTTATNFILSSDERLKENIKEVCDNRIKADWKTFELKTERGQKRYGVIAQELEKTNPEFVREDTQGFKSVAYIDLLIAKIAELEARLEKAGI